MSFGGTIACSCCDSPLFSSTAVTGSMTSSYPYVGPTLVSTPDIAGKSTNKNAGGKAPPARIAEDAGSESVVHADRNLVGVRKTTECFTGEAPEARVLDAQPKRMGNVIAQSDAVVHSLTLPSRVALNQ